MANAQHRLLRSAILAASLTFLASLSAAAEEIELQIVTKLRVTAEHIEYTGLITSEANANVFEMYESAHPKPKALLIESRGGGAAAAMELGDWMLDHELGVKVDTYCFSSCANYIFLAGSPKVLAPHASLMWHGGVTQPIAPDEFEQVLDDTLARMDEEERTRLLELHPRDELLRQLERSRAELVRHEARFFRRIGVDQRITVLGHLYERELLKSRDGYLGWDLSLHDLGKLGVREVVVTGGAPWDPRFSPRGQRIFRIRLEELPGFTPMIRDPISPRGSDGT